MSDQQPGQRPLDTGSGLITGADPAQPRDSTWAQVPYGAQPGNGVIIVPGSAPTSTSAPQGYQRMFTAEDLEAVRREEKEKLYGRIDTMDQELKDLRREREARETVQREQQEADQAAARVAEEQEMTFRELLARRDAEWTERFGRLEQERDRDRAVFEQERRLNDLGEYRRNRLEQTAGEIAPQLRDLVSGSSEVEIDASITRMIQKTQEIMAEIAGALPQIPSPPPPGVSAAAPSVGPLEQVQTTRTFSPDDIRHMDMDTYRKYRDGLLHEASRQYRGG